MIIKKNHFAGTSYHFVILNNLFAGENWEKPILHQHFPAEARKSELQGLSTTIRWMPVLMQKV